MDSPFAGPSSSPLHSVSTTYGGYDDDGDKGKARQEVPVSLGLCEEWSGVTPERGLGSGLTRFSTLHYTVDSPLCPWP